MVPRGHSKGRVSKLSELRFNPILQEWVITATHRQGRTFLPPASFCPLCPTVENGCPTEIPRPDFDIVSFENRFPSLSLAPPGPEVAATSLNQVQPSAGVCEVVVYTPEHSSSLASQPPEQILKLIHVWRHRFREMDGLEIVKYIYIFENKGEAVGVTLHHPHGQIYAYPFVPPVAVRELNAARDHHSKHGECLFCSVVEAELAEGSRVVAENGSFAAFIPFYARYPYEVHLYPKRHCTSILDLTSAEDFYFAEILKQILAAFDRLFGTSFPYVMAIHQRPSDGASYEDFFHFHIEFYPPMRAKDRLKFLAGSELGAGTFINDALPEQTAPNLKALIEPVQWKTT